MARVILITRNNSFRVRLFEPKRVHGNIGIRVEQFAFDDISIISTTDGMVQCSIKGRLK